MPMPAVTEDLVRRALNEVMDPEMFIGIVDLGLVYTISIEPVGDVANVKIEMTMTSPACPAGPQLLDDAQRAVARLDGVRDVAVKLVMTPPWTPNRMTDEARDQLGIF